MITLQEGEKIVLKVRKHWFILFTESFFLAMLVISPLLILPALRSPLLADIFPENMSTLPIHFFYLFGALVGIWLLKIWISFFVIWTDYYLDVLFVTTTRVVDIEQKGLFSREVSTLHFDRIQDITVEVHGIIPTFLNFGDLHIQTAGQKREFVVRGVAGPYKVKDAIMRTIR